MFTRGKFHGFSSRFTRSTSRSRSRSSFGPSRTELAATYGGSQGDFVVPGDVLYVSMVVNGLMGFLNIV
jgi:hypothetical protein